MLRFYPGSGLAGGKTGDAATQRTATCSARNADDVANADTVANPHIDASCVHDRALVRLKAEAGNTGTDGYRAGAG
jgi:hypothetical protein